jgi:hypothetical protein
MVQSYIQIPARIKSYTKNRNYSVLRQIYLMQHIDCTGKYKSYKVVIRGYKASGVLKSVRIQGDISEVLL